jgi:hypothetical protein
MDTTLLNTKQQKEIAAMLNTSQKIRYLRYIVGKTRVETARYLGIINQYVRNVEEVTRDRHIDTVKELLKVWKKKQQQQNTGN